jgi:hypothetical protein
MTDINTAAEALTGEWVKLNRKEHGAIEGRVLSFEQRPMTFEGAPVLNRKTGAPRTEWVLAVQTDGGDTIKFSLKEAGQRAISDAIKASGNPAKNGDRLKIAVTADPASDREQATYQARWTPDASPLNIPGDDGEDPF